MFETYYEIEHRMDSDDKYTDYKDVTGISRIYAICKCSGRIAEAELPCVRNPDTIFKRDETVCLWFLCNGSQHCGHRNKPKEGE